MAIAGVGLGLRWAFLDDVADPQGELPQALERLPFFEVAPENYIGRGGWIPEALERVADRFSLASHGLSLDLGGTDPLDPGGLRQLRSFLDQHRISYHSDHLCWSGHEGRFLHDLLPLPRTPAVVHRVAERISRIQDALGRPLAIENISHYVAMPSTMPETEFIAAVLEAADCRLLLDVNNVFVNATNYGFDPSAFIGALPLDRVLAVHVAGGHRRPELDDLLIDSHGRPVSPEVRALMQDVVRRTGPLPVIYERDNDIPALGVLLDEVASLQADYDRALAQGSSFEDPPASSSPLHANDVYTSVSEDVQRAQPALARLVVDLGAEASLELDPVEALVERSMTRIDAEALVDAAKSRLGVYRTLVQASMASTLQNFMPRTWAALGARAHEDLACWMDAEGPRSKFLRDIPAQFAAWARARWSHDADLPPYLVDLAAHELSEATLEAAVACTPPAVAPEPSLDAPLVFTDASMLRRYEYTVHQASVVPGPTHLLIYRDEEHEVRQLELTPFAHAVLSALIDEGQSVRAAVERAAAHLGTEVDDELLSRIAALLVDLSERGLLLGRRV